MNTAHLHALFAALEVLPESEHRHHIRELSVMVFEALRIADMRVFEDTLRRNMPSEPGPSDFLKEIVTGAPEDVHVGDATGVPDHPETVKRRVIGPKVDFDDITLADGLEVIINCGIAALQDAGNALPGLEDVIVWYEQLVANALEEGDRRTAVTPLTLAEEQIVTDAFVAYRNTVLSATEAEDSFRVEDKIFDQLGA